MKDSLYEWVVTSLGVFALVVSLSIAMPATASAGFALSTTIPLGVCSGTTGSNCGNQGITSCSNGSCDNIQNCSCQRPLLGHQCKCCDTNGC